MHTSIAAAGLGVLLLAAPFVAFGDERSDRGSRGGTDTPSVTPAPSPAPVQNPLPTVTQHNNGTISSSASASNNSGGNQGGSVTTGDQEGSVTVVNTIGESTTVITGNPNQGQPTPPAPAGTTCDSRGCMTRTTR